MGDLEEEIVPSDPPTLSRPQSSRPPTSGSKKAETLSRYKPYYLDSMKDI